MAGALNEYVLLFVGNEDAVFLQQKDRTHPQQPLRLTFWGGKREAGESLEATLARELNEELPLAAAFILAAASKAFVPFVYSDQDGKRYLFHVTAAELSDVALRTLFRALGAPNTVLEGSPYWMTSVAFIANAADPARWMKGIGEIAQTIAYCICHQVNPGP